MEFITEWEVVTPVPRAAPPTADAPASSASSPRGSACAAAEEADEDSDAAVDTSAGFAAYDESVREQRLEQDDAVQGEVAVEEAALVDSTSPPPSPSASALTTVMGGVAEAPADASRGVRKRRRFD